MGGNGPFEREQRGENAHLQNIATVCVCAEANSRWERERAIELGDGKCVIKADEGNQLNFGASPFPGRRKKYFLKPDMGTLKGSHDDDDDNDEDDDDDGDIQFDSREGGRRE